MRVLVWGLIGVVAGCRPSASVTRTMPVANLQAYRTVALSVRSTAFATQGQAMMLEQRLYEKLQRQCGFERYVRPGTARADVLLDLNITHAGRGTGSWIRNSNVAVMDTLFVLSDGESGELLGTARIQGKSSGMIVNNAPPELEAAEMVAKSVAELLAMSGCSGPRIAKAEPPPPPPANAGSAAPPGGTGSAAPPDDKRRADAEALNEAGKEKLRTADLQGALASFQKALALVADPRYAYNVCLTHEAAERWDDALSACRQARAMNPEERLVAKIDRRIERLQELKSGRR